MLSEAQKIIIRDICEIQKASLGRIVSEIDLGKYHDSNGSSIQEVLNDFGIERKDFDAELFTNAALMTAISQDPDSILELLDDLDLIVFKYILHNFRGRWEDRYPNALVNLNDRIFVWELYRFKS